MTATEEKMQRFANRCEWSCVFQCGTGSAKHRVKFTLQNLSYRPGDGNTLFVPLWKENDDMRNKNPRGPFSREEYAGTGSSEKTADIPILDWKVVCKVESAMEGGEMPRRLEKTKLLQK